MRPNIIAREPPLPHKPPMIRLAQNQLWKQGDRYFRIVVWERLAIRYKETDSPEAAEGTLHDVTKKEFCRLIKGAELVEL
jgi:hypothetical protein